MLKGSDDEGVIFLKHNLTFRWMMFRDVGIMLKGSDDEGVIFLKHTLTFRWMMFRDVGIITYMYEVSGSCIIVLKCVHLIHLCKPCYIAGGGGTPPEL